MCNVIGNMLGTIGILATQDGGLDVTPEETFPPVTEVSSVEDTVTMVGAVAEWVRNYALNTLLPVGIKVIITLLIFFVGKFVVKKIVNLIHASLLKSSIEDATVHFLCSLANGLGLVLVVSICCNYLKFGTGAIVAVLGSAGLALGLSLQGSLSNFAGGILLLVMKPFRVGDYIVAAGNEGVVNKMDIIYTTLITPDNRKIMIPNGSLSSANIINVTEQDTRRVDISIGVDYSSDLRQVKDVLLKLAKEHACVLQDEPIDIFVDSFDASAITMGCRVWTASENYWKVKWELQEEIKNTFDAEGISIPYERVDIHMIEK